MKKTFFSLWALLAFVLSACATSPTGRKQLIIVPDSQMNGMGAQAFDQMKQQTPRDNSPALNAYVKCIAAPLTAAAKDQMDAESWEIVVFKDDTPNAFALPGGKIGVHTGILKVAKTDAQLAAVMGHEVGHVIAKHGAERVSQAFVTQGGLAAIGAAMNSDSPKNQLLLGALGIGAQIGVLLPFGRTQESESDLIGLDLMARAGFNPRESVDLWQNMKAASGGKSPPKWLSTHPPSDERIQNLQAHMNEALPKYEAAKANAAKCSRPAGI